MHIKKFETVSDLNTACAGFMLQIMQRNQPSLICAATGSSPTGAYEQLITQKDKIDTAGLKFVKLDEWASLPMEHPGSCEFYLQQHLLKPLKIPAENFTSFDSMAADPEKECRRVRQYLEGSRPIDLCILGLGLNGHVAFNDPADTLQPHVHLARLSATSLAHPMVTGVPGLEYGYTLGMADIMRSKAILLIVTGQHKKEILSDLLKERISTLLPASFLWLHANAHCYYCEN